MAVRVSQVVIETAGAPPPPEVHASQLVLETGAYPPAPDVRSSQLVKEVAAYTLPDVRASQVVLEILVFNHRMPMPSVYPTLPGLDIDVVWRPKAVNFSPQTHTSGSEVRIAAAQYPLHEFELKYNLLRNRNPTEVEFRQMMGFFLALGGVLNGFCFSNPYDNSVTGQSFVTTDGINSQFGPLVRTYGYGNAGTEPVGYVDMTQPFNVYVDGFLKGPTDATYGYTVVQTLPVNQLLKFTNTPGAGHVITIDMTYYYYVRFSDDTLDFTQVLYNIFELQSVKLMSLRGL